MRKNNGNRMAAAVFAMAVLVGMALLGLYLPAAAQGESTRDLSILTVDIESEPYYVENGGEDNVTVMIAVNRLDSDLDHDNSTINFFHTETGETFIAEFPDPVEMEENITTNNTRYTFDIGIPLDTTVGTYNLTGVVFDMHGENVTYDMTKLQVNWSERAPMMDNDTIYMHEDATETVDLDDHFSDVNGQDLVYYVNMSNVENITITFTDDDTVEISAPMDWNGPQGFDIAVTDGIDMPGHNETFTMKVIVAEAPDNLRAAEDLTIEVDEVVKETAFDPQTLFYDPDGPADFVVSLGWEWALNETNVSVETPIWNWTDANFSVDINDSDNTDGMAKILADLEEGSAEFPLSAWVNGTPVLNATAMVEVIPVNDVPMPKSDTITLYMNEAQTFNLSALFEDPDSEMLNFTVNSSATENVNVVYDWMTFDLTLTPAENITDTTTFMVNATDGIDFHEYTMNIEIILRSYAVTGTISFEEVTGVDVNLTNVTFKIGESVVELDENGTFAVTLDEGDYEVTLMIPDDLLYSEDDERSGYEIPTLNPINLTAAETYDLTVSYRTYEAPVAGAVWADLDFENVEFDDDDDLMVILPVMNGTENNTGWDTFVVKLIIVESDDEELNFTMEWDSTEGRFEVTLEDDDMDDLGEGKKEYYFTNENGTEESSKEKYEFKGEDENAGPMTIIILVALILLVLVALIFIMRKPSEEDFDEDEDETEEDGRTCPGCGENVTDDEAEECPYCGEDLEAE